MDLIGKGGVWKVFGMDDNIHVFRVPLGFSESTIKRFIENHSIVKNLGLPTLEKVNIHIIDGIAGIVSENLNVAEEKIYVTPNSVYTDSDQAIDILNEKLGYSRDKREICKAEAFRYENKLQGLTNFDVFVESAKADLEFITKKKTLIEFDSYFFGTRKYESISPIDYKLADLDHVFPNVKKGHRELMELNLSEFYRAMNGFLKHFVADADRPEYLK